MPENEIKQQAEQMTAEVKAAKEEAAAAKAEVETLKAEVEKKSTEINNLDASVKEQQKVIEEMKSKMVEATPKNFAQAMRAALEAKKEEIAKMFGEKKDRFEVRFEVKSDPAPIGTGNIAPNGFLGISVDPTIHADRPAANVFINILGLRPRTGNKLGWIEATSQSGADYVTELAQNTNRSDVSFTEKTRAFGKIATLMTLSTELEDWFEQLYNYCVSEGIRLINAKIDQELYSGAGDDATYPNKVYGLKGAATAFSAMAAGKVEKASIADVILDAAKQIAKAGYNANVAVITWDKLAELEALKDKAGNYLYNQVTGMLRGIRVFASTRLAADEVLVLDTVCAEAYAGNSYELEFIRNGAYDAYDVYFRKAVQVKVTTPAKKGIIYVADVDTAIAALYKESDPSLVEIAEGVSTLAGTVNEDGQIETHPNAGE